MPDPAAALDHLADTIAHHASDLAHTVDQFANIVPDTAEKLANAVEKLANTVAVTADRLAASADKVAEIVTVTANKLVASADTLAARLGETANAIAGTADKLAGTIDKFADAAGKMANVAQATAAKLSASADKLAASADKLSGSVTRLAGSINDLAGSATKLADGIGKLAGSASELAGSLNNLAASANQLAGSLNDLAGSANKLAASLDELAGSVGQLAGSLNDLAGSAALLADSVNNLADAAGAIGQLAGSAAAVLTAGLAVLGAFAPAGPSADDADGLGSKTRLTITRCTIEKDGSYNLVRTAEFKVMLNPGSFRHRRAIRYDARPTLGQVASPSRFSAVLPDTVEFGLTVDGTGAVPPAPGQQLVEVAAQVQALCAVIYDYVGKSHEPSHVRLLWGTLILFGRMTAMATNYTLFKPNGEPLRAAIDLSFVGFMSTKDEEATAGRSSPDLSHSIRVRAGDTLPLLCNRIYGDPSYYAAVARANGLVDFRRLLPGAMLRFPPLA